jgi:hypothetical protein
MPDLCRLDMTDESLDALLESVSGDDLIDMGIVFKNVKTVTQQLENLTNQSGENLDMAQRCKSYTSHDATIRYLCHMIYGSDCLFDRLWYVCGSFEDAWYEYNAQPNQLASLTGSFSY